MFTFLFSSCKRTGLILFCLLFFFSSGLFAQVQLSLDYTEKTNETQIPSGGTYTMLFNYSISGTTGTANGVKIVVNLPDYIVDLQAFAGTPHAPVGNFSFDLTPGQKKLTINFIDPVPLGSTGTLEVRYMVANGTIQNGTTVTTTATLSGTAATSVVKTHNISVYAYPYICAKKELIAGGALDNFTDYQIAVSATDLIWGSIYNGFINATNITISDQLPPNTEFISATVVNRDNQVVPSTINMVGNVLTATLPNIEAIQTNGYWITNVFRLRYRVRYKSTSGFSFGQVVTNTATVTFTPLGGAPITATNGSQITGGGACVNDLVESTTLQAAVVSGLLIKEAGYMANTTIFPGQDITYFFDFQNTGNIPLQNVEIYEDIPSGLRLAWFRFDSWAVYGDYVQYQTNLNATWTTIADLNGFSPSTPGEYITKIKIRLKSPFDPGARLSNFGYHVLVFKAVSEVSTSTPIQNCMYWTSTTIGAGGIAAGGTTCNNSFTLDPRPNRPILLNEVGQFPYCGSPYQIGQVFDYAITMTADNGGSGAINPVIMAFPEPANYFDFVVGSASFDPLNSGISATPTFEYIPNFGGTGKFLLRWKLPSGTILPYGTQMRVWFKLKLTAAGLTGHDMKGLIVADNVLAYTTPYGTNFPDALDLNGNGDFDEIVNSQSSHFYSCPISFNPSVSLESVKWVKGSNDANYLLYPNNGTTVPGGNADYRLVIKNKGNVPMKDIQIVDLFPYEGDKGVLTPNPRLSDWRPNLAAPISAPAGITIFYSTVINPCRDEIKQPSDPSPFPTGCVAPNWSSVAPVDITTVRAIKIDFGATVLTGGDSLVFTIPMRAPVNAPANNEIAWNSFAYVATRTDNNQSLISAEPIKVGMRVMNNTQGAYGNRVWFDDNENGIQETAEGGIDGVTVRLFKPLVAGSQFPATDSLVNFTVTANGGFYLFTNLPPGDYYAVFSVPALYNVSPQNAALSTAANDSDGQAATVNAELVTITPITNISINETDLGWDQGFYCTLNPTVTPIQVVSLGSSVTLIASGGTTYAWEGPNGFTASTASITINPVTADKTGIYTVKLQQAGCRASLNTGIYIGVPCVSPSNVQMIRSTPNCNNPTNASKITLTNVSNADRFGITQGTTYTGVGYNGAASISPLHRVLVNSTSNLAAVYTLRLFNGAETCFRDTTFIISSVPLDSSSAFAPVITLPSQVVCITSVGVQLSPTVTPTNGTYTYAWAPNDGSLSSNSVANPNVTSLALGTKTYTVTVTNTNNGCTASASNTLTVESCPIMGQCNIQAVFLQQSCKINGTLNNNLDDYFTVSVTGTTTSNIIGGKFEVLLMPGGQILNIGGTPYGQTVIVGTPTTFLSNGVSTYTLRIRNFQDNSCQTQTFTTVPSASCSNSDCSTPIYVPVIRQ